MEYEKAVELPESTSAALQSWSASPGDILTVVDRQGDCCQVRLETAASAAVTAARYAVGDLSSGKT